MRIAIIADIHFRQDGEMTCGTRHRALGAILLGQAISRLNRVLKPDLSILLGDLIDEGNGSQAMEDLQQIQEQTKACQSPLVILPGNHDGDPERFYQVFPRPPEILELGKVRFINNIDSERPGYNAFRSSEGLELLRKARQGWDGRLVSLQHVPILPPGKSPCPYHYENIEEILREFQAQGVTLSIGAHYHPGVAPISLDGTTYLAAPALCEEPFQLLLIELSENGIDSQLHALQQPANDAIY